MSVDFYGLSVVVAAAVVDVGIDPGEVPGVVKIFAAEESGEVDDVVVVAEVDVGRARTLEAFVEGNYGAFGWGGAVVF